MNGFVTFPPLGMAVTAGQQVLYEFLNGSSNNDIEKWTVVLKKNVICNLNPIGVHILTASTVIDTHLFQ